MKSSHYTSQLADLQARSKSTDIAALITLRQLQKDGQELITACDNFIIAARSH